jgi:hypothetical protein
MMFDPVRRKCLGAVALINLNWRGKKERILVSQSSGDFCEAHIACGEELAGLMDTQADEAANWRAAGFLLEQSGKMSWTQTGELGQFNHGHPFIKMTQHIGNTSLNFPVSVFNVCG